MEAARYEAHTDWLMSQRVVIEERAGRSWSQLQAELDELGDDLDAWSVEEKALIPAEERRILLGLHIFGVLEADEYIREVEDHLRFRTAAMVKRYNKNRHDEGWAANLFEFVDDCEVRINL